MIISNAKEYTATIMLCNSVTTAILQVAQDDHIPEAVRIYSRALLISLQQELEYELVGYWKMKHNIKGDDDTK